MSPESANCRELKDHYCDTSPAGMEISIWSLHEYHSLTSWISSQAQSWPAGFLPQRVPACFQACRQDFDLLSGMWLLFFLLLLHSGLSQKNRRRKDKVHWLSIPWKEKRPHDEMLPQRANHEEDFYWRCYRSVINPCWINRYCLCPGISGLWAYQWVHDGPEIKTPDCSNEANLIENQQGESETATAAQQHWSAWALCGAGAVLCEANPVEKDFRIQQVHHSSCIQEKTAM